MNTTPLVTTCTIEREERATRTQAPDLTGDLRFAELIALSHVDAALAARYDDQPRTVLAEFGIELAAGQPAPALPRREHLEWSPIDVPIDPTGACGGGICLTRPGRSAGLDG